LLNTGPVIRGRRCREEEKKEEEKFENVPLLLSLL